MEYNIHRMWPRQHLHQQHLHRPLAAQRLLTVKFYIALVLIITLQTSAVMASTLGSKCQHDMDCTDFIKGSSCSAMGYCECAPYYVQYNRTSCLSSQLLGGDCILNEQCTMKVSNSSCLDGACRCVEGYLQFRKHTCLGPAPPSSVCYSHAHCQMYSDKTHCDFLIPNLFGRCQCTAPAKLKGGDCVDNTIAENEAQQALSSTTSASTTTASTTPASSLPSIITSAPLVVSESTPSQAKPEIPSSSAVPDAVSQLPVSSSESSQQTSSEAAIELPVKEESSANVANPQIVEPQSEEEEENNVSVEEQGWGDEKESSVSSELPTIVRTDSATTQQMPLTPAEIQTHNLNADEENSQDGSPMVTDDYPYKPDYEYNEEHHESEQEKEQEVNVSKDEIIPDESVPEYSDVIDNTMNFDYEAAQEEMEEEEKQMEAEEAQHEHKHETEHQEQEEEEGESYQETEEQTHDANDPQISEEQDAQQSSEHQVEQQSTESSSEQQAMVESTSGVKQPEIKLPIIDLDQSASEDLSDATTHSLMDEISSHDIQHQEDDEFVPIVDSIEKESEKHEIETNSQQHQTPEGSQSIEEEEVEEEKEVVTTQPDVASVDDNETIAQETKTKDGVEDLSTSNANLKDSIAINNNLENVVEDMEKHENEQANFSTTEGQIADTNDDDEQQQQQQQQQKQQPHQHAMEEEEHVVAKEEEPVQKIDETTDALPEAEDASNAIDEHEHVVSPLEPQTQMEIDQTNEDVASLVHDEVAAVEEEVREKDDEHENEIEDESTIEEEEEATTIHYMEKPADELHEIEHMESEVAEADKSAEYLVAETHEETHTETNEEAEVHQIENTEAQALTEEANQSSPDVEEDATTIPREDQLSLKKDEDAEHVDVAKDPEVPSIVSEEEDILSSNELQQTSIIGEQVYHDEIQQSHSAELPINTDDNSKSGASDEQQSSAVNQPEQASATEREPQLQEENPQEEHQGQIVPENIKINEIEDDKTEAPAADNTNSDQDQNSEESNDEDLNAEEPHDVIKPEYPIPAEEEVSEEHNKIEEKVHQIPEQESLYETIESATQLQSNVENERQNEEEEEEEVQQAGNAEEEIVPETAENQNPLSSNEENPKQDEEDSKPVKVEYEMDSSEHLEISTDLPIEGDVVHHETTTEYAMIGDSLLAENEHVENISPETNEVMESNEDHLAEIQESDQNKETEISETDNENEQIHQTTNEEKEDSKEQGNQTLLENELQALHSSAIENPKEGDKEVSNESHISEETDQQHHDDNRISTNSEQEIEDSSEEQDHKTTEVLPVQEETIQHINLEENENKEDKASTAEVKQEIPHKKDDDDDDSILAITEQQPPDEESNHLPFNGADDQESDVELSQSQYFEQNESIMDILNDLMKEDVTDQPEFSLELSNNLNSPNHFNQEDIPDLIASDSSISEEKVISEPKPVDEQTEAAIDPEDKLITFYPDMQDMQEHSQEYHLEDEIAPQVLDHPAQQETAASSNDKEEEAIIDDKPALIDDKTASSDNKDASSGDKEDNSEAEASASHEKKASTDEKEASDIDKIELDEKQEESSGDDKQEASSGDEDIQPSSTLSPMELPFDMSGDDDMYPQVIMEADNLIVETTTLNSISNELYSEETLTDEHPEVTTIPAKIAELTTQTMLNLASRVTLMEPAAPVATTLKPLMSTLASEEIVTPEPHHAEPATADYFLTTKPSTSEIRKRVELSLEAVSLGLSCTTDKQCQLSDPNTVCNSRGVCDCAANINSNQGALQCSAERTGCSPGTFQCRSSGVCISWFFVCDGRPDCNDASDEECTFNARRNQTCPEQAFLCGRSGRCISRAALCDGRKQCPHGEDELGCSALKANEHCPPHTFRCKSGECLPEYEYCNAIITCRDGSDEPPHLCGSRSVPHFFLQLLKAGGLMHNKVDANAYCPHRCSNGRCRSTAIVCSGRDGCGDGTDEQTCSVCRCPAVPLDNSVFHVSDFLARHRPLSLW